MNGTTQKCEELTEFKRMKVCESLFAVTVFPKQLPLKRGNKLYKNPPKENVIGK